MTDTPELLVEADGEPATADALGAVLTGYGHFTAMQVRDGRVRGLRFHLARLDGATRELFGTALDGARVRAAVTHALSSSGRTDASVRVHVYQPDDGGGAPVTLVVSVRPPGHAPAGPMRVKSVPYQRPAAHLKHLGGFGQGYHLRRVAAEGFGEALLTGPGGEIAEGAVTNIGFVAGSTVVWPTAPHLRGVTLQVLEELLDAAGVPQIRRPLRLADVPGYDGAFLANSRGTSPISLIDDVPFPADAELLAKISELYASAPWDTI
ncbi:aminotransferase class IV [Actinacidiphila rubida]|uniref:Branched-chain amino acid aminotransferase/4-amino-4-deoxychorismate lyase n=1 Tax=Actinacidiphila rubida TaxID=310780 RepID=A0A1H8KTQ5_9ACTN|nr:aminotransferase class IV [Actinacidiphila rubida]SEN96300.1 Branched-chain amino acid aminotransferase/4-amino-4-deoxychorismate lyase [Actinacidiphila rubida]